MKIVTVLLMAVFLMCCTINSNSKETNRFPVAALGEEINFSGMHYAIYSCYNGGAAIANITKDSLECEYYKKQLVK